MLLELQSVHGGYGKKEIIKGVDFHADHGDIVCLAGPNGCGKTTLFRLILGSLPLSDGHIFIDGYHFRRRICIYPRFQRGSETGGRWYIRHGIQKIREQSGST